MADNDYDGMGRLVVKMNGQGVKRWLLPRLRHGYKRWLDSQSAPRPGEPDRRCDTIMELVDPNGASPPWALVVEVFSGPDGDAVDRSVEYTGRFRRELRHGPHGQDRYRFVNALLFLTGTEKVEGLDMMVTEEGVGMAFLPRVVQCANEDAVVLLGQVDNNEQAIHLLALAPLMKGGNDPEVIARLKALLERETDVATRRTLGSIAVVFAELTGGRDTWTKALEEWNVIESPFLRDIRNEGRKEQARAGVVNILSERFPGLVPSSLRERIQGEKDVAKLDRWLVQAALVPDVEAFLAKLD